MIPGLTTATVCYLIWMIAPGHVTLGAVIYAVFWFCWWFGKDM